MAKACQLLLVFVAVIAAGEETAHWKRFKETVLKNKGYSVSNKEDRSKEPASGHLPERQPRIDEEDRQREAVGEAAANEAAVVKESAVVADDVGEPVVEEAVVEEAVVEETVVEEPSVEESAVGETVEETVAGKIENMLDILSSPEKLIKDTMTCFQLKELLLEMEGEGCQLTEGFRESYRSLTDQSQHYCTDKEPITKDELTAARREAKACLPQFRRNLLDHKLFGIGPFNMQSVKERFALEKGLFVRMSSYLTYEHNRRAECRFSSDQEARWWVLRLLHALTTDNVVAVENDDNKPVFESVSTFMDMDALILRYRQAIEYVQDKDPRYRKRDPPPHTSHLEDSRFRVNGPVQFEKSDN
eukprot:GHVU01073027.1.p1 GENE.GHVU01073027.1~~GHVU01073027.1.p1  ORF type:complete len:370 (+),score=52.42 GHVU01073027.1:32-1111(+)